MKKRIVTLIVALSLLLLVGCFDVKTVTSISLIHQPKTEYALNEEINYGQFKIKVQFNDGTFKEVSDLTESNFTDFSTSQLGTFVGKINYEGVSINFDYKVVPVTKPSGFTDGTGTEGDPYIVGSAEQFLNIESATARAGKSATDIVYYKLEADIVLDKASLNNDFAVEVVTNASIDGAGKKITSDVILFKNYETLTFKNANILLTDDSSVTESPVTNSTPVLTLKNLNVEVFVQIIGSHYGVLVRSQSTGNIEINNCDITGTISTNGLASPFLGNVGKATVVIKDSTSSAYVQGAQRAAAFMSQHNDPKGETKSITIEDSYFTGTLVSSDVRYIFVPSGDTTTTYSLKDNDYETTSVTVFNARFKDAYTTKIITPADFEVNFGNFGDKIKFRANKDVVKYIITWGLETTLVTGDESDAQYSTVVYNNNTNDWLDSGIEKLYFIASAKYEGSVINQTRGENLYYFGPLTGDLEPTNVTVLSKELSLATINGKKIIVFDGRNDQGEVAEVVRHPYSGVFFKVSGYDSLGNLVLYKNYKATDLGGTKSTGNNLYKFTPDDVKAYLGIN